MASDEIKKKWGTIFMGNREASVQQLQAMQEPLHREKQQKDQAADYMERVRSRAADRAREILGAAYAERQKVLEEARTDAARYRKDAELDASLLKTEGQKARSEAAVELEKAQAEREEAERIRLAAKDEGYQEGMRLASAELAEFRAELGQSLSALLRAIERERHKILDNWREDIVSLVQCASQAGAGYILEKEHKSVLRNLVFKSLDLLENRSTVSIRVNPQDEEIINDIFRAARERFPELRQWVVTGDVSLERGGLIAESGTGSVDLRRENFREMVNGVLSHLGLPEGEIEEQADQEIRDMVEREVASIAAQTPEMDREESEVPPEPETAGQRNPESMEAEAAQDEMPEVMDETAEENPDEEMIPATEEIPADEDLEIGSAQQQAPVANENPSLEDLEEELFPLEDMPEQPSTANVAANEKIPDAKKQDPLSEGGFL